MPVTKREAGLNGKGVCRFSVSAPPDLLEEFNATIRRIGYDRSKAVQAAMRSFLSEYKWTKEVKGTAAGGLIVIYDHEVRGLEEELTDIQHRNREIVKSTMHVHLDRRLCLEIVAVKGEVGTIQDLAEGLMRKRGVKQVKLAAIALPTSAL